MFELVFEYEADLRKNYLLTLENINKFARINKMEGMIFTIRERYEHTIDLICAFNNLQDNLFEYESQIGELGFSVYQFDEASALRTRRGTMKALDASYDYNAYNMYNWFSPRRPGMLCTQVYAQRYGQVQMRSTYVDNSDGRL